jgi:hypothetical protein
MCRKNKIIEILKSETFQMSDEGGTSHTVVEDFDGVAERIMNLFAMPVADVAEGARYDIEYRSDGEWTSGVGVLMHRGTYDQMLVVDDSWSTKNLDESRIRFVRLK